MQLSIGTRGKNPRLARIGFSALTLLGGLLLPLFNAQAFQLQVVNGDGTPVSNFRWMVEEDHTFPVVPGLPVADTLSVRMHTSHSPVIANGNSSNTAINLPSDKRYFVSVLPDSGYSMGGAAVAVGQSVVKVVVNSLPIPSAQISILAFEDNAPINNAPDLGEKGLGGFTVRIDDAGGRYGISGGQISVDVYGNPLGTEYDTNGNITKMGSGVITTDADGRATIRNIAPGKYGIQLIPPAGQDWHQTTTIEGTKVIDAWPKAGEPRYVIEFGTPFYHIFMGFVHTTEDKSFLTGSNTISGKVVSVHNSRPPDFTFWPGRPFPGCWVGLNATGAGSAKGVYAKPCNEDSTFSIAGVPPGFYQLVLWDENLDMIIAIKGVNVVNGQSADQGDVLVFDWFARTQNIVFMDRNKNGLRDCVTAECMDPAQDDVGIPDQVVNLRFRDGTVYQSAPTDMMGYVPFEEIFPFFSWLVAEVDYTRFKTTGATFVVDAGGQIPADQGWAMPSRGLLNPQPQLDPQGNPINNPATQNNLSRTETGNVLTQAFQAFAGQTLLMEWGKAPYEPGENGGISGIVHYATTRAENDPRMAVAEPWEPGIPRVQVNLYRDSDGDGNIDDTTQDSTITYADVDNYPFRSTIRPFPQTEDVDRNSNNVFDLGDAVATTRTDSWDDNLPSHCQGKPFISHGQPTDCYDGLYNFNQIRNGVFDGGYIFEGLPSGTYIVETITPPGYELVKEQNRNVDFGEDVNPGVGALMLPPTCVGESHEVPPYLTLFPGAQIPAPFAGDTRRACDRKQVVLTDGKNAAANFFLFTEVPLAANVFGRVTDDLANEGGPGSPNFGEKFSPAYIPISFRDWTGREVTRVYTDQWGTYNALLPSTFTANRPAPSGMSPNMLTACINSPGPISNPAYVPGGPQPALIMDPYYSRKYGQFCYTFQYMPGTTTYLDTPIVHIAAFAGSDDYPPDCEALDGRPRIHSMSGPSGGPYLTGTNQIITIKSMGLTDVENPAFSPSTNTPRLIKRDFGFGSTPGRVRLNGNNITILSWTPGEIRARVPSGSSTGPIEVVRGDNGRITYSGVTLTIGGGGTIRRVSPSTVEGATPIQDAIDAASPGDLILVAPGVYSESIIMWKPVRLQGWGEGSTYINAAMIPAEKFQVWRNKLAQLVSDGSVHLLPGQTLADLGNPLTSFANEEGAGIFVLGKNVSQSQGGFGPNPRARIDGFNIMGAMQGGGITVNGYAHYLDISNNRIQSNAGSQGGGIRLGHPFLTYLDAGVQKYTHAQNTNVRIRYNQILQNGALASGGGGVSINTGSDDYIIQENQVCGNFTRGDGAGISHFGLSPRGRIRENAIFFNQSFNQMLDASGGGIAIVGAPPLGTSTLTPGTGSVRIQSNHFQGNQAGAGDGGAISTKFVNGADVQASRNTPSNWHLIEINNNMIVNNMAGLAGGAIALQDTARSTITFNTIANNDSTATAGTALNANQGRSTPQVAGIASRAHSTALASAFGTSSTVSRYKVFSNPVLTNDIIWHNRSFYWDASLNSGLGGLVAASPAYNDLGVLGTATPSKLNPRYSDLTSRSGYSSTNVSRDPRFVREYFNGARGQFFGNPGPIGTVPAFDEGGNMIDVRFGPLALRNPVTDVLYGDYRLSSSSTLNNTGSNLDIPLGIMDFPINSNQTEE